MDNKYIVTEKFYSERIELFETIKHFAFVEKLIFVDNLESIFKTSNCNIDLNNPWFAFAFRPCSLPDWYTIFSPNPYYKFTISEWNIKLENCRGILTFSESLKNDLSFLRQHIVKNLIYPLPFSRKKWSPEKYSNAPLRRIIQFGQDYRCLNAIFMLPPSSFEKILLATCYSEELHPMLVLERTNLGKEFRQSMTSTTSLAFDSIDNIENYYDNSIFFLHLYDTSIDWIVLKCISDNVPLLINRLPSILEYLGSDYPLFYSCYEEAIEKALNTNLILSAHKYLIERSKEPFFSLDYFISKLTNLLLDRNNK